MVERKNSNGKSKRLYKSRKDKMIDGVCGGFAEYFNIDVTLIRIVWALSLLINGLGLIAYILAMIFVPVNPLHKKEGVEENKSRSTPAIIWGSILIIIGFIFLSRRIDLFPFYWDFPWNFHFYRWWIVPYGILFPIVLIILGVLYIIHITKGEKDVKVESKRKNSSTGNRKLYRSNEDKVIGGVCGGLARYFNLDATLLRIGLATVAIVTNIFFWGVIYLIFLIVLPHNVEDSLAK